MPIYEYKCQVCGNCFEKLLFAGDEATVKCPRCTAGKVNKQISCTSFMKTEGIGKCASGNPKGFS